jgi:serine/threonine protein kinase
MPATASCDEFLSYVRQSKLADEKRLTAVLDALRTAGTFPADSKMLATHLVQKGVLTVFQCSQLLNGRFRNFVIGGKYKILEPIGAGGMGKVYLCEQSNLKRLVAVKMLTTTNDAPGAVERFYREAQAVAALNHANIVKAHDLDAENGVHYMVMEYVDGASLQDICKRLGKLDYHLAVNYIYQAALGLQHAHEASLVHRDIKPSNILLERSGTVKILDLGLARFFGVRDDELTKQHDGRSVLGTADYISPEQALCSHEVDIRTDIYSLGCTLYYILVGHAPFPEGTVTQKLLWHQMREPEPIQVLRPDLPHELVVVIRRMMAKDPAHRYQTPAETAEALWPWAQHGVPAPDESIIPKRGANSTVNLNPGSSLGGSVSAKTDPALPATESTSTPPSGPLSRVPSPPSRSSALVRPASATLPRPLAMSASSNHLPVATPTPVAPLPTAPALRAMPANRSGLYIGIGAGVGGLLLVGVLVLLLRPTAAVAPPTPAKGTESNVSWQTFNASKILMVSVDHEQHVTNTALTYPTIKAALAKAQPGMRIRVVDPVWSEILDLANVKFNDVVVESARPTGQFVTWKPPSDAAPEKPLIRLHNVRGLEFRGFVMDGGNQSDELIHLTGDCFGVAFDGLTCRNFGKRAIGLSGVNGEEDNKITFKRVRFRCEPPSPQHESVLTVLSGGCKHVTVTDCRFEGPCSAAVRWVGPTSLMTFSNNRFFGFPKATFLYQMSADKPVVRATLNNNTFSQIGSALYLETMPGSSKDSASKLNLSNNLFEQTSALLTVDDLKATGETLEQLFERLEGNVCDPRSGIQGRPLAKVVKMDFVPLPTDKEQSNFLFYPSDSPLTNAGTRQQRVGAVAP